jgi:hypothetical protein
MQDYQDKVKDILTNADKYHKAYYDDPAFSGPSLYFHNCALETRRSPGDVRFLEYVYATLASWGMHRPGKGGPKMLPFDDFRLSAEALTDDILKSQGFDFWAMDDAKWAVVERIFRKISIMKTETMLVGNSKVMHHMMPDIVPPIDRNYTLEYLHGNTNIKNDPDKEWRTLRIIVDNFFRPVLRDEAFRRKADDWVDLRRREDFPFDTSLLKVVDTLVIGAAK